MAQCKCRFATHPVERCDHVTYPNTPLEFNAHVWVLPTQNISTSAPCLYKVPPSRMGCGAIYVGRNEVATRPRATTRALPRIGGACAGFIFHNLFPHKFARRKVTIGTMNIGVRKAQRHAQSNTHATSPVVAAVWAACAKEMSPGKPRFVCARPVRAPPCDQEIGTWVWGNWCRSNPGGFVAERSAVLSGIRLSSRHEASGARMRKT